MLLRCLEGADLLGRLGTALDDLHGRTDTPVTARRLWQQIWVDCYPQYRPFAVVVEGPQGTLEAAAVLASRRHRGITEVVPVGHGPSDQVRLPATGNPAAAVLGPAVVARLAGLPPPWRLTVRHLPGSDPVVSAILGAAPAATVATGDVSPATRFNRDRSLRSYVSRNHHQQVRRMSNRMKREGLEPRVAVLREPADVEAVLPDMERIGRLRDRELQRPSQLDDPCFGPFFCQVILAHAARGEVELVTLHLGSDLAAFVLSFVDGPARRMWSTRLDPRYGRFGVGRIANNTALESALADPGCKEFDWMRGVEAYKSSMANHEEVALDLHAWSSRSFALIDDAPRRVKTRVKAAKAGDERLERAWMAAVHLRDRAMVLRSRVAGRGTHAGR